VLKSILKRLKMKRYKYIVLFFVALILANSLTPVYAEKSDEYYRKVKENLDLFREVFAEVSTKYVDDIDPEEFIRAGIDGMLGTLDPYSVFISEDGKDDLIIMTTGQYGGIGTVIGVRGEDKILTVISPMEGTPAERLGIRAGDQIIEIDSMSTIGLTTEEAAKWMRGEPGTEVKLKIRRPGIEELQEYSIVREIINVKDVSTAMMLSDEIGYIRLARFSRKAGEELKMTLEDLQSQGMKSLILDLRGNPGGLLESAVEIAGMFVPKNATIVTTRGMIPESKRELNSNTNPVCEDCQLVVLVDAGSASASEIVSGAIQDLDRGVIIGEKTFGKGLVQSLYTFRNGTELKLTTAKYFTPSGRLIQKVDYFGKDNPVLLENVTPEEGDQVSKKFYTKGGREVFGGGGISPDIEIKNPEISQLQGALFRNSMYFQFANEYVASNTVEDALSDEELTIKFEKFLEDNKFDYKTEGESEIEQLREIAEEKGLNSDFIDHLKSMEGYISEIKKLDFENQSNEISRFLRMEFAYRQGGAEGRMAASIDGDLQLQKALELLKNRDALKTILSNSDTVIR